MATLRAHQALSHLLREVVHPVFCTRRCHLIATAVVTTPSGPVVFSAGHRTLSFIVADRSDIPAFRMYQDFCSESG